MDTRNSRQIETRASEWLLKRESTDWSDADQAHLEQWLNASVLHRVAFLRLEAGWHQVNRIKALGAGFPARTVPGVAELVRAADEAVTLRELGNGSTAIDESPHEPESQTAIVEVGDQAHRRARFLMPFAASLMILLTGVLILTASPWAGKRYSTPIGGVSSVPLSDGSSVTLNTASDIRVHMSDRERRVELTRGEVFFEVARDPGRPFIVTAGPRRIVVVGTKFSVRLEHDDVRIVVTEGRVNVRPASGGSSAVEHLSAGAVAIATADAVDTHVGSREESEELLSWRFGFVVFHETTLADAVAEFQRYSERDIIVRDPQIAAIRLSGKFRANNLDAFVRLLESTSPVRAEYFPDRIVLAFTDGVASKD